MEFIDIVNDYTLLDNFSPEEFISYIYDSSNKYYGEIYFKESSFYFEFILEQMEWGIAHAVIRFDECMSKEEITERMPSLVQFIKFVLDFIIQIKKDIQKNEDEELNQTISRENLSKWSNYIENNSIFIFLNYKTFIKEYLAQSKVRVV